MSLDVSDDLIYTACSEKLGPYSRVPIRAVAIRLYQEGSRRQKGGKARNLKSSTRSICQMPARTTWIEHWHSVIKFTDVSQNYTTVTSRVPHVSYKVILKFYFISFKYHPKLPDVYRSSVGPRE